MADKPIRTISSRIAIFGHPIHPTLVHFPVACLLLLVGSDAAYLYSGNAFWAKASLWLAGIGALSGWIASTVGLIDLVTIRLIRRKLLGWCHAIVAVMMLSLASLNWLWRFQDSTNLLPWAIALTLLTAVLVGLTGALGGTLVYEDAVGVEIDDK